MARFHTPGCPVPLSEAAFPESVAPMGESRTNHQFKGIT